MTREMMLDALKRVELHETELNFRALIQSKPSTTAEEHDLSAAIFYEYARESDSIRMLAAEYAALPINVRRDVEAGQGTR